MGFNRITWTPGRERRPIGSSRVRAASTLREQRDARASARAAMKALEGSLLSLTAVLGSEVRDLDGRSVGRLRDVVVQWTTRETYPRVKAIVLSRGGREILIGADELEASPPATVRLRQSRVFVSPVEDHDADVALAHDVLDRQVVDARGVQVVRPADLYLVAAGDGIELVGVEVGARALLRRLGPKALRTRVRPQRVIDWAAISAFVPARDDGQRHGGRRADIAGAAGTGIVLSQTADGVKRLGPLEVRDVLGKLERRGGAP